MQWGCPPSVVRNSVTSSELTELMVYDGLYPSGFERDNLLNAHLVRATAYGALSEPSGDLDDHTLFHLPPPEATPVDEVDAIKEEQLRVMAMLDLIF